MWPPHSILYIPWRFRVSWHLYIRDPLQSQLKVTRKLHTFPNMLSLWQATVMHYILHGHYYKPQICTTPWSVCLYRCSWIHKATGITGTRNTCFQLGECWVDKWCTTVYWILYQSSKFDQKGVTCLTYDILYKCAQSTLSSPDIFWSQYTLCNILHFPHLSWKARQHNLGPNWGQLHTQLLSNYRCIRRCTQCTIHARNMPPGRTVTVRGHTYLYGCGPIHLYLYWLLAVDTMRIYIAAARYNTYDELKQ